MIFSDAFSPLAAFSMGSFLDSYHSSWPFQELGKWGTMDFLGSEFFKDEAVVISIYLGVGQTLIWRNVLKTAAVCRSEFIKPRWQSIGFLDPKDAKVCSWSNPKTPKRSVFAQKKALVGLVKYIIFRSIPLLSPLLSHYPSLPPLLSPWNDYYPTIIPLVSHYLSPALSPSLSYFDSRSKLSAELQLADAGDTCAAPFRSRRWSTWAHGARAHQRDGFGCYIRIYIVLYLYYIIFYLFILYLYSYYIIFYLYYIILFISYFIYIKSYLYYIIFYLYYILFILNHICIIFYLYYIIFIFIFYLYLYSIILYYIYIYIILYLYLYYIIFIFILYYIYYIIFVLYYINIILILYIIFVLYYIFIIILYYIYIILYLYYIILYYIILYNITFGTKNQQGWFTQNLKSFVIGTARFSCFTIPKDMGQ